MNFQLQQTIGGESRRKEIKNTTTQHAKKESILFNNFMIQRWIWRTFWYHKTM